MILPHAFVTFDEGGYVSRPIDWETYVEYASEPYMPILDAFELGESAASSLRHENLWKRIRVERHTELTTLHLEVKLS